MNLWWLLPYKIKHKSSISLYSFLFGYPSTLSQIQIHNSIYKIGNSISRWVMTCFSTCTYSIILKFYDCVVFSQIINSYPLVAVFWIFGGSKNLDSMFLFQPVSLGAVSCYCQQKKSWHCCRGILCPYFSDATLLAALLQKRSEIC